MTDGRSADAIHRDPAPKRWASEIPRRAANGEQNKLRKPVAMIVVGAKQLDRTRWGDGKVSEGNTKMLRELTVEEVQFVAGAGADSGLGNGFGDNFEANNGSYSKDPGGWSPDTIQEACVMNSLVWGGLTNGFIGAGLMLDCVRGQ